MDILKIGFSVYFGVVVFFVSNRTTRPQCRKPVASLNELNEYV